MAFAHFDVDEVFAEAQRQPGMAVSMRGVFTDHVAGERNRGFGVVDRPNKSQATDDSKDREIASISACVLRALRQDGTNHISIDKAQQLVAARLSGQSIRASAKIAGVSHPTAINRLKDVPALCICGASASHQGWCAHRYSESAARQRWMAVHHQRRWFMSRWRKARAYPTKQCSQCGSMVRVRVTDGCCFPHWCVGHLYESCARPLITALERTS
jgi:hypothetical protein